jgi:hypothetical protein
MCHSHGNTWRVTDKHLIHGAIGEGTQYVGVGGIWELVSFLIEPLNVVLEAFFTLLGAPL